MPELVNPASVDGFKQLVGSIEAGRDYQQPEAFALGLATVEGEGADATVLDVHYTRRNYATNFGTAAVLAAAIGQEETGLQTGEYLLDPEEVKIALTLFDPFIDGRGQVEDGHPNIDTLALMGVQMRDHPRGIEPRHSAPDSIINTNRRVPILGVVRSYDDLPQSAADIYLRLYALSDRNRVPNTVNIVPKRDFGLLPNVVTTEDFGTYSVERWNEIEEQMIFWGLARHVRVLDKFPRMLDHVVPTGVRIADPSRVRLGAHLGEGTTVMPEGAANFNSGTVGASMVEGRISAGVFIGIGSDIGGGVSTMGTMSGGNKEIVHIGEECLLEANSGIGISLGDKCRVEAGTYIKSTTPVLLPSGETVKAATLSGKDNMMFRRNATTGVVEVIPNKGDWGGLNDALHATN